MTTAVTSPGSEAARVDWNSYRAFLSFDAADDSPRMVLEQLASWLREKGLEPDLGRSELMIHGDRELLVIHHETAAGRDLRARLTEKSPLGEWRSELTVHTPHRGGQGWLTLRVSNSEHWFVAVPRLAGYLVDVLGPRDGPISLSSKPVVTGESRTGEVIDWLCDPERQGLLLLAGTDEQLDFAAFAQRVERWTREVRGLAQVVILDPPATRAFREEFGASHAASPWTLRTYLPVADPAVSADARRHKILGTERLGRQPDPALRSMLGRIARAYASARTLPGAVTKVSRSLARQEDVLLLGALAGEPVSGVVGARPPAVDEPATVDPVPAAVEMVEDASRYLAQVELVKNILRIDDLTEATLYEVALFVRRGRMSADAIDRVTQQLEVRQRRIDELEDEVADFKKRYEDEQLDYAIVEEERGKLADENRWLRGRLAKREDFEAAYGVAPSEVFTAYPASFEDLIGRLPELESRGVVFSDDPDDARDLDDYDLLGKLVRATWDALLVLCDYVRARESGDCGHGVDHYLSHTPRGYRPWPPGKHVPQETQRTMNTWGDERVFKVPPEVDARGYAEMEAHFRLGHVGMVSPRMYYLDHWAKNAKVYVGYIGSHLTNTKTN